MFVCLIVLMMERAFIVLSKSGLYQPSAAQPSAYNPIWRVHRYRPFVLALRISSDREWNSSGQYTGRYLLYYDAHELNLLL